MKSPFLKKYAQEIPLVDEQEIVEEIYNANSQMAETSSGESILFASWRTSTWTSGRYRKGYYNKKGKWLPGKYLSGKTDRRKGK